MILAVGAVHSHLVRQGLRSFSYLVARSGECLDVALLRRADRRRRHRGQRLPGRGRDRRPPRARPVPRPRRSRTCLARFKEAINQGLLKVMSKMGISIISSYRGGYNFEAVGLSRSLCREYFPGPDHPHLRHRPHRHQEDGARSCTPAPSPRPSRRWRSAASTATAAAARPTRWKPR